VAKREWRPPPQWRKSGYWNLQVTQRANDHMWRGGDGRTVTTMPPPSWEGFENRMDTPQEQQPVRRQPGKKESGRPNRDNMDAEGGTLEWSTGGKEEGRLAPPGRDAKDGYGNQPPKAQNIEERQKGLHSSGATAE